MASASETESVPSWALRVRHHRKHRGMTLQAVAKGARVSTRYLTDVEHGRANPSLATLGDLAAALGVPLWTLLLPFAPDEERERAVIGFVRSARSVQVSWSTGTTNKSEGPIALIGLRGAGKSTVGPLLASRLGRAFEEVDEAVAAAAQMSIGAVFEVHGEAYYRKLEREALLRHTDEDQERAPSVLSVSGGVVTDPQSRALLFSRYRTVWLKASPQRHWDRVVQQGDERPMDGRTEARAELNELHARRVPFYAEADFVVETDELDAAAVADVIAKWWRSGVDSDI